MTSYIRLSLLIIFLSSCSTIKLETVYFDLYRDLFFSGPEVDLLETNTEYSYVKITYGKFEAIYILSEIDEYGIELWVGSDRSRIWTYKGLILRTNGLENDFQMENIVDSVLTHHPRHTYNNLISLMNPRLLFSETETSFINESMSKNCHKLVSYQRRFHNLGISQDLDFCFDVNANIISSTQFLDPVGKKYTMNFHYQYDSGSS